jgi:SAM-dependent methyltransferase
VKPVGERLVPDVPWMAHMIVEELACLSFVRDYYQGAAVLDNGCGTGHAANFMAQGGARYVVGVDVSDTAIERASRHYQHPSLRFCVMDCLALGFGAEVFDFVGSLDVIEHLAHTDQYLWEVHRTLRRGGRALISTPNKAVSSPGLDKPSWPFHVREFYLYEFRAELEAVFDQVQVWGVRIPVYESHPVRKITNLPISHIKHFLPPRIRLGIGALLRHHIKSELEIGDVLLSADNVEATHRFVALCYKAM